uniref:Piwi domain-containing protein n=1 Tax=Strongyloides papillosus TaxID=174720 RepID=A0A0N5BV83_STREA
MKISLKRNKILTFDNGRYFLTNPLEYGYQEGDIPLLHGGKRLGIGGQKSIKLIEGTGKEVALAVAIDTTRTVFHEPMILSDKYYSLISTPRGVMNKFVGPNAKKVIDNMKGLMCHCIHLKNKRIIVHDITVDTALTKKININGKETSIFDYYKSKYNITLKCPDYPLVVEKRIFKGVKDPAYYPMELLRVAKYQRVKQNAQTPDQTSVMASQSSIPPYKRLFEINKLHSALQLTNNDFLKEVEMSIDKSILATNGRQLRPPTILCGNKKTINIKNMNGSWEYGKGDTFVVPSTIQNWCVIIIQNKGRNMISKDIVKDFVKMYIDCARSHGITISDCAEISECPPIEEEIKNLFDYLALHKTKFVLFMTEDNITHTHNLIKLYERKYGIPTQDLKQSTASKVVKLKQFRTLENIVLKSNIKNGGHNYELNNVIKPDLMIIGIGFNHTLSGDTDSLSVVGYSANTRRNPTEFVGDIRYIRFARDGQIEFYNTVIENTVNNFKNSRGKLPKEIIIYRTSGSEGRYNDYCAYEIPYAKAMIKKYAPGAKLSFIVVEKSHNVRFFKDKINSEDKAPRQNVTPGSVVDSGVTNPKLCEFFLTSHSGIKGTVTTPKYIILYDDLNNSMDYFETLSNSLAYCYQIVSSPTSLPAPIYIANQYAERGRNILNANNHSFINEGNILDEDSANECLTYASTIFNNLRINA